MWSAYKAYDKVAEYEIIVRPWIDGDWYKKPHINTLTQFAMYKCMHKKCIFFTNDEEQWKMHMQKHIDMFDVLKKFGILQKSVRDEQIGFRECSYCSKTSKSDNEYNHHMGIEHVGCILQCAHCFYRCNEMDNIVLHYEAFHKDEKRKVLLLNEKREFGYSNKEVLESNCAQYVKKIQCGQGKRRSSQMFIIVFINFFFFHLFYQLNCY